jgi:hypothetical protein
MRALRDRRATAAAGSFERIEVVMPDVLLG